jgi:hypothetical protein
MKQLLALSTLLAATGCTAIIGVQDLPPATGSPDAMSDASHDATHDAARDAPTDSVKESASDAPRDSRESDARASDANDAAPLPAFEIVPPSPLEFGDAGGKLGFVACGGSSVPTRQLTLTNNGASPFSWWSSLGLGGASPFKLSTACTASSPCTLSPGAANATVVTITGPLAPTDAGLGTFEDTLTLFSSLTGSTPTNLDLRAASYGAVLTFSQSDINFGMQPENQPDGGYPHTALVENNGNAPFGGGLAVHGTLFGADGSTMDATGSSATEFVLTQIADAAVGDATLFQVAASEATPFAVSFEPKGSAAAASGSVFVNDQPGSILCAPLPLPVTLEGQGTVSPISVTSSLNFNTGPNGNNGVGISCGQTPPSEVVTVTNAGVAAQITSLTLLSGAASMFTVPTTPISIPAGTPSMPGSVPLTVTAKPIPSTAFPCQIMNDTLMVTTNIMGDLPHAVTLQLTAAGVILAASQTTVDFGSVQEGREGIADVYLANLGNVRFGMPIVTSPSAQVTWQLGSLDPYQSPQDTQLRFQAVTPGSVSGQATLSLPAGTPICNPPGAPFNGTLALNVTGDVLLPLATTYDTVSPRVKFDGQCQPPGVMGTAQMQSVTIKTTDPEGVSWTAKLIGPGASFFQLGTTGGNLPSDASIDLTITAVPLTVSSGLSIAQVETGLGAELMVTFSGGSDSEEQSSWIWEQVQGDYFTSFTTTQEVPNYGSASFAIYEWNAFLSGSASVTSGSPSFVVHNGPGLRPGQPLIVTVTDNGAAMGATTMLTLSPASMTTGLCGPLPTPVTASLLNLP